MAISHIHMRQISRIILVFVKEKEIVVVNYTVVNDKNMTKT